MMWRHRDETSDDVTPLPRSNSLGSVLSFALGAGFMYFFDPVRGRSRRARVRDKLNSAFHQADHNLRKTAQYTRGRAIGLAAEARARFSADDPDDWVLCERVRSALGRAVSHPSAVQVNALDGIVTLCGAVLAHEAEQALRAVARVRGVREVVDALDVHKRAGNVPELQGGTGRSGMRAGMLEEYWDPLTRSIAGFGGAALALWGLARRDLPGLAATAAGAAVAARGMTNLPARRLTGLGAGRRAVDVQKTITIAAPLADVFGFFADYENFPRFMSNVREVRAAPRDTGRSHWVVAGPMGVNLAWDADLTSYVPNQVIAWRSVEGASVENAGIIRFQTEKGGTRVDIKLSYNPPGGAIGHFLARLFGADPKCEMDSDLARVKTMLETGHPPRDAAQPIDEASGALR